MNTFIGVKIVQALAMTLGAYNKYRGWEIPADEDPYRDGYLVEYPSAANNPPNHIDHAGYISWAPKEAFEEANRVITALPFGHAIEAAKVGKKIARAGWNGKGIFVRMAFDVSENGGDRIANHLLIDTTGLEGTNDVAPRNVIPWLASQTDLLAQDWMIVD